MSISSSWDIGIVVFFAIVTAYSFIIGRKQSLQILVGSYIAIIATQGIGNLLGRLITQSSSTLDLMGIPFDLSTLSIAKIFLFALFVIIFAVKSGVEVTFTKGGGSVMNIILTGAFGILTAGLIASTVLTYAMGRALLDPTTIPYAKLAPLAESSPLMLLLLLNQDIFFTLPALLLIGVGFVSG